MAYEAKPDFVVEAESSVTDRYQNTVPETVGRALKLANRDEIHYTIKRSGQVVMARADAVEEDEALGPFLHLLTGDIKARPGRLQSLSGDLLKRISVLTEGVEYNINAALPDNEDE